MNRSKRAIIATETMQIVDQGWYESESAGRIEIKPQVDACLAGTRLYCPEDFDSIDLGPASNGPTAFEVGNETTLAAGHRLVVERGEPRTLLLNFASAKNPGGGFLGGSQAQEESLARSSALYASLQTQMEYYTINRECKTAFYTDHMILSPAVPVFRNDATDLLPAPYVVGMLTSPAVNAGAVLNSEPERAEEIAPVMAARIANVLSVAASEGYEQLVLGAWGCGVFRNEPETIADLFAEALLGDSPFAGRFKRVVFAVLDNTADESIVGPFRCRFAGGTG
ncbi:TIGR02452 family protein [Aeoliella sp.]|uniref:TIGR02452 family protein n=1 Tax=Aeoliella sp. TaxID=2795800 RepID=UPI003CCBEFF2